MVKTLVTVETWSIGSHTVVEFNKSNYNCPMVHDPPKSNINTIRELHPGATNAWILLR